MKRSILFSLYLLCSTLGWAQVDLEGLKSEEFKAIFAFFNSKTYVFEADIKIYQSGKVLETSQIESIKSDGCFYNKNANGQTFSNGKDYVMVLPSMKRLYVGTQPKAQKARMSKKEEEAFQQRLLSILDTTALDSLPDVSMRVEEKPGEKVFIFTNEAKAMEVSYSLDAQTGQLKNMRLDHDSGYYDRYELIVTTWRQTLRPSDQDKLQIEYYINKKTDSPGKHLEGYQIIQMEK